MARATVVQNMHPTKKRKASRVFIRSSGYSFDGRKSSMDEVDDCLEWPFPFNETSLLSGVSFLGSPSRSITTFLKQEVKLSSSLIKNSLLSEPFSESGRKALGEDDEWLSVLLELSSLASGRYEAKDVLWFSLLPLRL